MPPDPPRGPHRTVATAAWLGPRSGAGAYSLPALRAQAHAWRHKHPAPTRARTPLRGWRPPPTRCGHRPMRGEQTLCPGPGSSPAVPHRVLTQRTLIATAEKSARKHQGACSVHGQSYGYPLLWPWVFPRGPPRGTNPTHFPACARGADRLALFPVGRGTEITLATGKVPP